MWLSSKEVEEVLGVSRIAVLKQITSGRITARQVPSPHGGRPKWEIALDSLPREAQDRYWAQIRAKEDAQRVSLGRCRKAAKAAEEQAKAAELVTANDEYAEAPVWQKDIIDERLLILTETQHMSMVAALEWCKDHGYKCSRGTLYRWRTAYAQGGKNALATKYGTRAGQSSVPDDAFETFCEAYLNENGLSIAQSYQLALGMMVLKYPGRKKYPSQSAFEYRLRHDQERDESVIYYARHGEAAWNRKYAPYIKADYSASFCGETAVSDHMQFDVMVYNADGKPVRPWLTAWCDWKSRKLLAWDIHIESPCSDHIFRSFHTMCSNFGLPQNILIDNGKDYRSKDFAGGRAVTREASDIDKKRTNSLMEDLGIKTYFAEPYNAQRKNIERLFRDFHNSFERHLKGYTATNIVKRPESLKKQIKNCELITFDELVAIADDFIVNVFNQRAFKRNAVFAGMSPNEVWEMDNPVLRRADERTLSVFLQRTSDKLRVTRNGVKDPQLGVTYWCEEMVALAGSYVYLRRDLQKYGTAWVYAVGDDRKPLCLAKIKGTIDPFADSEASKEELKEQIARKKAAKKAVRKAAEVKSSTTVADKMEMLKAATAYTNEQRGYTQAPRPRTIEMQITPLDETARQQERYLRKAHDDVPVPVIEAPKPQQKIYLTRTEMECAKEAINE